MKKKIGLVGLLAVVGVSTFALTGCGGASKKQVNQNQTDIANAKKSIDSLKESLEESKSSLEESVARLNTYLNIEKIAANGDAISSLEAKIKELKDAAEEADASTKTDLESAIARIKTIEDSLITDYVSVADYETAIANLNAIDVKVDGDIASLKSQVQALETAKATVEKVNELSQSLLAKEKALQDKIDIINAEIGTIALDDNDKIISIQDQINDINEKIGSVYRDQNNEIVSLQEQIDELKAQIYSNELKEIKGNLVYKLSDSYATFQDEMAELKIILIDKYNRNDIESIFLQIQKKYNHEMTGSLYKGITLITLANSKEEAEEIEAHYEILINNYINPAKFDLMKELCLEVIKAINNRIDIDSGYPNQTIREKQTAEVNAVEWFDDDTLEEFIITEEDDEETQKEKSIQYKAATQEKIDLMVAATNKALTINEFLAYFNDTRSTINIKLAAEEYSDAKAEFLKILDDEIYDLDEYYNCNNIKIEITEIDPQTGENVTIEINDLAYQFFIDKEALDLVAEEVDDYLALDKYIKTELNKVNTGNTKLVYIDSKISDEELETTELDDFNAIVREVLVVDNYAKLNNTIEKSDIQLEADKEIVDLYIEKAKAYDELIKYCNDSITKVTNLLKDSVEETNEKLTVNALIADIHKYENYITADLVIAIPEDNTETTEGDNVDTPEETTPTAKTVAEQLAEDKAVADLLVQRATTFKNIYEFIYGNAQATGLNAYIDTKTTAVNEEDANLFTVELKNNFKAEYADLAVAEKYDAVIKNYTTIKEFTDYEASIIGEEGVLDLIKKNVDTFVNILIIDDKAKTTINDLVDLSAEYKTAFIDNFKAFATYDTNKENTKAFAKKEAFDTYYTDIVKSKIDSIVKVAQYENSLINKKNSVESEINKAYADEKITQEVNDYLLAITADIYATNTTVTENKEGKLVTAQTIAEDAYQAVEAKLQAVEDAITTFYNIDQAAKALATRLDNYKTNQKRIFLNTNYKYRDDELYAPDNVGKYNGFNQAALEAWNEYDNVFDTKIDEITYEYVVPTEKADINYAKFIEFMASLLSTEDIGARYTDIETWYSLNTEENPNAGMQYTITAKFEELDALKVTDCRTYFIGKLEAHKNELKELVTSAEYKGNLENLYEVYKGSINGDYGKTTTMIISKYEDGISELDTTYAEAIAAYKTTALANLDTMYNTYCTENPYNEEDFEPIYTKYKNILSADEYTYMEGETEVTEPWSEASINTILANAEDEFEAAIEI